MDVWSKGWIWHHLSLLVLQRTLLWEILFLLHWWLHLGLFCRAVGTDKWWKPAICASVLVALFIRHTHYLAFVHFDYGYNMKFNIASGAVFNNNNNKKSTFKAQNLVPKDCSKCIHMHTLTHCSTHTHKHPDYTKLNMHSMLDCC